jgi:hypothetical protein
MDLKTLNTRKIGDRAKLAMLNGDAGSLVLGDMGTVVSVGRRGVFPVIGLQFDKHRPGLPSDNTIVVEPDCYCDLAAPDEGLNSSINPNTIVACLEVADTPRSAEDEQELRERAALAELEALAANLPRTPERRPF